MIMMAMLAQQGTKRTRNTLLNSEEVESHVPSKRKFHLLLYVFLILLGLLLIIFGSIHYEKEEEKMKKVDSVGVVFDAGGSGTRIIIYSYSNKTMHQLKYEECEGRGLAKYSESEFPVLKKMLTDCLIDGGKSLPKHKKVPVYFAATAGMRLLQLTNKVVYDKIWTLVKDCLHESEFKMLKADTITGFEEAKWAWVAANYLKGTIQGDGAKFGTIDFGSTSLQVAFNLKSNETKSPGVKTLSIDGSNTTIYGHSYLCYGIVEMERRFLAKIVKNANYSKIVKNPCFFTGYSRNISSDYLWKKPCSSGNYAKDYLGEDISGPSHQTYSVEGTSNFKQCHQIFTNLIIGNCSKGSCGMNDEFQPKVNGKFFALSTFYYLGQLLGLTANSSKEGFYNAAQKLCGLNWNGMQRQYKGHLYLDVRCFQAVYGYYILADGFKFDHNTWNIEYIKKIDGAKVGWSLGLIYSNKDAMYTRHQHIITVIRKPGFIALIVIGAICILATFLTPFIFIIKDRKGTDVEDPKV